jgi:hypothetical protein
MWSFGRLRLFSKRNEVENTVLPYVVVQNYLLGKINRILLVFYPINFVIPVKKGAWKSS